MRIMFAICVLFFTTLVVGAEQSSPPAFPIDAKDKLAIIDRSQPLPSLRTPYEIGSDGKHVRSLLAPDDLSYSNLLTTVISYLDGDTPHITKMTASNWREIFVLNEEFDLAARQVRAVSTNPAALISFDEYQRSLLQQLNKGFDKYPKSYTLTLNLNHPKVSKAVLRIISPPKGTLTDEQLVAKRSAAFDLTPLAVIAGLKLLQDTINGALDRADEIATSQLFGMREHVAASIADMDVVFKNRMNQTFDKLNEQERNAINAAVALTNQTNVALQKLENDTYLHAADLLCEAAVSMATFNILPIFKHKLSPDIMCITTPEVRDIGTLHERFLTFRGVSLRTGGDYPEVTLTVPTAQKSFSVPAGGGNTILQIPLPGGINGGPGDMTPRGSLIAVTDFNWGHASASAKLKARWMFLLNPYLVSSIDVSIVPKIRQASYKPRYQDFYVEAGSGRTNTATWSIVAEPNTEIVDCAYSVNTKVGNSEVTNVLRTAGACQMTGIARGQGAGHGGGSIGIRMWVRQKSEAEIAGPRWQETKRVVNQSQSQAIFVYDVPKPPDSEIIDYNYNWRVDIQRNTEELFTLTNSNQSDTRVGAATMDSSGTLTVTLNPPMNP